MLHINFNFMYILPCPVTASILLQTCFKELGKESRDDYVVVVFPG